MRSTIARSLASSKVKPPEIWACPEGMRSRITGAEWTLPSRTIASALPTFFSVASPNRRAPTLSNDTETYGSPTSETRTVASEMTSPVSRISFLTT